MALENANPIVCLFNQFTIFIMNVKITALTLAHTLTQMPQNACGIKYLPKKATFMWSRLSTSRMACTLDTYPSTFSTSAADTMPFSPDTAESDGSHIMCKMEGAYTHNWKKLI